MQSNSFFRLAWLGQERLELLGPAPRPGDPLLGHFSIPPARRASSPLTGGELRRGLVVVSTLPNIRRHACLSQIVDLDEHGGDLLPGARFYHVAADEPEHWAEVDRYHAGVRAPGYSLHLAPPADRAAFVAAFGVGVARHRRIAHGLFTLREGRFLAVDIPVDQMAPMDVGCFLVAARRAAGDPTPG
jgi:hypothetical protein